MQTTLTSLLRGSAMIAPAPLIAGPAAAHTGHLAEAAGHDHWLGAAALGAAIAIGLWQALKHRDKKREAAEEAAEDAGEEELQEA
ncbi:DUF6732 family protein [Pseudooceanicola nanhaiensis]|uniref:DUF6732 family protein n=1 Tax=Pseudooceanicola nanhaiensis TaxID=375761 RepID=UPI001CD4492B|nr:DUF6732 family protein [Pseudooceanicola nanhaiensis]MCA0918941.1 hypothetical protein [Pseudooceanicola nanhaiensis]